MDQKIEALMAMGFCLVIAFIILVISLSILNAEGDSKKGFEDGFNDYISFSDYNYALNSSDSYIHGYDKGWNAAMNKVKEYETKKETIEKRSEYDDI